MKTTQLLILTVTFLLSASVAQSQKSAAYGNVYRSSPWKFGVSLSANKGSYFPTPNIEISPLISAEINAGYYFSASGQGEYPLMRSMSILMGISYHRSGYELSADYPGPVDNFIHVNEKYSYEFVGIPLGIIHHVIQKYPFALYFQASITPSYMPRLFFRSTKSEQNIVMNEQDTLFRTSDLKNENFNYFNISAEFDLGFSYVVNRNFEFRIAPYIMINILPYRRNKESERFYNCGIKLGIFYRPSAF